MGIIELLLILIALSMCLNTVYPGFNLSNSPVMAANRLIGLVISLVVLYIVFLLVIALIGDFPLPRR